jgi:hypothetical protein
MMATTQITGRQIKTPAKIGDQTAGDYLNIAADGTTTLIGDATVYRDEYSSLIGQRLESPASDITQNNAEGSLTFDDGCTLADYVTMNVQLNHDWKLDSTIYPHLHWWQASANVPNWMIQYRYQDQGSAKTTAWTPIKWSAHIFTYTAGTLNQISRFGSITPSGGGVSDILQIRLLRDTDNDSTLFDGDDPLAGDVDAVFFDVHIEVDAFGSKEEYVK